jgi:hypothetical protein
MLANDDHVTVYDHKVIQWEAEVDSQDEASHGRVVGWNIAAMTEEDAKAAEQVWKELAKQ